MGKIALVTKVGPTDQGVAFPVGIYEKTATVPFMVYGDVRDISVGKFMKSLKKLRLEPSERIMDLLVIAASMYAADTRIERTKFAEDSWTRIIDLYIPVEDEIFWASQANLLSKIFRFLTGDVWSLHFRKRTDPALLLSPRGKRKLKKHGMPYQTNTVCLFSGGMDSFIGAVDLLESGVRPLLVGHAKSADVTSFQENCGDAIARHYKQSLPERIYAFLRIPKDNLFGSVENSERGRSFLFLTLGMICASSLSKKSKLVVPENGMISLNIPLTPLRIGSHSTRTTHPHYFVMMQELFNNMGSGVTVINPYKFKTKGEMLKECKNQKLIINTKTMSCSHPSGRWEGKGNGHCGYCVPCIIRQAAFKAAGKKDRFPYRHNIFDKSGLDITTKKGADILAFKYMIEKLKKKPAYLTAAIRSTGPLGDDVSQYIQVYQRSIEEVNKLIKKVNIV